MIVTVYEYADGSLATSQGPGVTVNKHAPIAETALEVPDDFYDQPHTLTKRGAHFVVTPVSTRRTKMV